MEQTIMSGGQVLKILETAKQHGATMESVQKIIMSGILPAIFNPSANFENRDAWLAALGLRVQVPEIFEFEVDHDQAFELMVAAGNYDSKNNDLTAERFPITGTGKVRFQGMLSHFNRMIESTEVIKQIAAIDNDNSWSIGAIEHLLAFGAKFPEEQRKYPIIALGSVARIDDNRYVPKLSSFRSKRRLYLSWFGHGWHGWSKRYRFLAVRKISVS